MSPRWAPQDIAESNFVGGAIPWAKFTELGPAMNYAALLILNRPVSKAGAHEMEADNRLGLTRGPFQFARAVPHEFAHFGIAQKIGQPVRILRDERAQEKTGSFQF